MADWRRAALEAFVQRFPGDNATRLSGDARLYLAAMEKLRADQWPMVADRLRLDHEFLPAPGPFAKACEAAAGTRERVAAKWAMSELHAEPGLARYAVRDWLVDRCGWPPMAPEPGTPAWPFHDAVEAEFVRAVDRMERGNRPDGTGTALSIVRARFLKLADALGRRDEADRALVACERVTRAVDRGSLERLAARLSREGRRLHPMLAKAVGQ